MDALSAPGERLRRAACPGPAQMAGVINAYCAILAERAGLPAVYLSGGAQSACMGLPDLGALALADMTDTVMRIADAVEIPLLVDADTGFGGVLGAARTARTLCRAGAAGMHLEDQLPDKRCGHRPGKVLCSAKEMCARLRAAVDARGDDSFVVMARTDALAAEGERAAQERAAAYVEAGADMVFLEGATAAGQYGALARRVGVPVLANITEFGVTPLLSLDELAAQGVAIALYPVTVFRIMARAAERAYRRLRAEGTQRGLVAGMQTRAELYELVGYHKHERMLDEIARPDAQKAG